MPRSIKKGPFVDLHLAKKVEEAAASGSRVTMSWLSAASMSAEPVQTCSAASSNKTVAGTNHAKNTIGTSCLNNRTSEERPRDLLSGRIVMTIVAGDVVYTRAADQQDAGRRPAPGQ